MLAYGHATRMMHHAIIYLDTLKRGIGCSLEKDFAELICMNH